MPKKPAGNSLTEFCRALKAHDHFLLSCHVTPEGDAIGSILAMDSLLRRLGKKTMVVAQDPFPKRLFCLSGKRWNRLQDLKNPEARHFKALLVADCPTLERIGKVRELVKPGMVLFNIDHHISNLHFGQYNYVRPEAAASGEVVFDIFKHLKMPLNKDEARNLYVALSTDTGSFKYGNTTVQSHRMAAELINTGIDIEGINEQLYATYSLNKIQLYSRLLSRVKTAANGQVAWVLMKSKDLRECGASDEDAEGFIDFLKYLREVKVAFFMSESLSQDTVRVSFRSKGTVDVNKIATHFKGGGHRKASGCLFYTSIEDAEAKILGHLQKKISYL